MLDLAAAFSAMAFGQRIEFQGELWVIVVHGVGYNADENLTFHLAIKADAEQFPANVFLIYTTKKKQKEKQEDEQSTE